jgi:hypothetical protein
VLADLIDHVWELFRSQCPLDHVKRSLLVYV